MKTGNLWQDFEWRRAAGGYKWRDVGGLQMLVPSQDDSKPLKTVSYRPMSKEHAGLYREFAELKPEPDAVLAFANRYGHLGWPVETCLFDDFSQKILDDLNLDDDGPLVRVELGADLTKYPGVIGEFLHLNGHGWNKRSTWSAQIRNLAMVLDDRPQLATKPSRRSAPLRMINEELRQTVGPSISWSPADNSCRFSLLPRSLAGAIWLQTALALCLPVEVRVCQASSCQNPIEISRSGGARTDAIFCSDRCKSRDYRERKKEARHLASKNGSTPSQIAKQLRTDPATVRSWLR